MHIYIIADKVNPNRSLEKFTFFLIYNGNIFFAIIKV